jgi:hypothetical protein
MVLEPKNAALFYKLHSALMFFVNQRCPVISVHLTAPEDFANQSPQDRVKLRDALLANLDLIESFVVENPARLEPDELDIVRSWGHLVVGKFIVLRYLSKVTVFLSTTEPAIAYGVLALSDPFDSMIGPALPIMTQTVLLPFMGGIVYDGIMTSYNVSFGPGMRRSMNESFKEAKARHGIITSLPMSMVPLPVKPPKSIAAPRPPSKDDKDDALRSIMDLIDPFCKTHLNDEYAVLCRKLAEKLARKRPSPLLNGSSKAWASGIVRAVGGANFLHDKSQTPYMRATDIDHYLGVSQSAGAAKATEIRKLLKIHQMDADWTLPSKMDNNPLVWMIQVNGMIVDVRRAAREVQEIAFMKGLIPYVPADRQH